MERDVPSIATATRSLARTLKQFRSNRLQKPRWLQAAETGDLEFIQKRLREGQDVEAADDLGRTALCGWPRGLATPQSWFNPWRQAPTRTFGSAGSIACRRPFVWRRGKETLRSCALPEALADANLLCTWRRCTPLDLVEDCAVQSELARENCRGRPPLRADEARRPARSKSEAVGACRAYVLAHGVAMQLGHG